MADVTCSIDELAAQIVLAVQEYTENVSAAIEREIETTADAVLKEIQSSSAWKDQTGKYRPGWTKTREASGGSLKITVWNRARSWLTWILERGHAKRGGGRVEGRPHIAPAYDRHVPAMEERIKEIIRKGGSAA